MLILNFKRLFLARGIYRPNAFLLSKGFSINYASRLANNRVRQINLDQLERLCIFLNCTPNDLLQWFPTSKEEDTANHPLASLRHPEQIEQMAQLINAIPLDKLTEVQNLIKEKLGK